MCNACARWAFFHHKDLRRKWKQNWGIHSGALFHETITIFFHSHSSMSVRTRLVSGWRLVRRLKRKRRSLNHLPLAGDGRVLGKSYQRTAALLNLKKVSMSGQRRSLRIKIAHSSPTGLMSQNPAGQIW